MKIALMNKAALIRPGDLSVNAALKSKSTASSGNALNLLPEVFSDFDGNCFVPNERMSR